MKKRISHYEKLMTFYAQRRVKIRLLAKTIRHREIADRYGISDARVSQIVNGK